MVGSRDQPAGAEATSSLPAAFDAVCKARYALTYREHARLALDHGDVAGVKMQISQVNMATPLRGLKKGGNHSLSGFHLDDFALTRTKSIVKNHYDLRQKITLSEGACFMRGPSARITDAHVCPAHGGGIIVMGMPTVLVGKMPASRITDLAVCGPIPNLVAGGETTVLIGKLPAARLGDPMAHGGKIATGFPTVWIGDRTPPPASPQVLALLAAAKAGLPLVEECPLAK